MAEHSTELAHCSLLINTTASRPRKQGLTHKENDGDQAPSLHGDRGRLPHVPLAGAMKRAVVFQYKVKISRL
jgi:hypothetical protein